MNLQDRSKSTPERRSWREGIRRRRKSLLRLSPKSDNTDGSFPTTSNEPPPEEGKGNSSTKSIRAVETKPSVGANAVTNIEKEIVLWSSDTSKAISTAEEKVALIAETRLGPRQVNVEDAAAYTDYAELLSERRYVASKASVFRKGPAETCENDSGEEATQLALKVDKSHCVNEDTSAKANNVGLSTDPSERRKEFKRVPKPKVRFASEPPVPEIIVDNKKALCQQNKFPYSMDRDEFYKELEAVLNRKSIERVHSSSAPNAARPVGTVSDFDDEPHQAHTQSNFPTFNKNGGENEKEENRWRRLVLIAVLISVVAAFFTGRIRLLMGVPMIPEPTIGNATDLKENIHLEKESSTNGTSPKTVPEPSNEIEKEPAIPMITQPLNTTESNSQASGFNMTNTDDIQKAPASAEFPENKWPQTENETVLLQSEKSLPRIFPPTLSGTQTIIHELKALITYFSPQTGPLLVSSSTSPQFLALEWLAANNNIKSYPFWKRLQRFALATLYFSTNGDGWFLKSGWLTNEDECTWAMRNEMTPPCDNEGRIVSLFLDKNGLNGTIPPELSLLSGSLRDIQLAGGAWNSHLNGAIPSELLAMTNLVTLHLQSNHLEGFIPCRLEKLTGLKTFRLDGNRLTGSIPTEIGALMSLEVLNVGNNALGGAIPSEMGMLIYLRQAKVHSNNLKGQIPSEIGKIMAMDTLWSFSNEHTGMLPSEIGLLVQLRDLRLNDNLLSWSLPYLGMLTSLTSFDVARNFLEGTISSEIGSLTNLVDLDLSDNAFTGTISSFLGSLMNLRGTNRCSVLSSVGVQLPCNAIYPLPLARYSGGLRLHNNKLQGTIPKELQLLTDLHLLSLFGNKLSGEFQCPELIEQCMVSCNKDSSSCRVLKPGLLSVFT